MAALLLLEARSQRGLTAALALALSLESPDLLKAATITSISRQALTKIRRLGRSAAPKLYYAPPEVEELALSTGASAVLEDARAVDFAAANLAKRWSTAVREARNEGSPEWEAQSEGRKALAVSAEMTASNEALGSMSSEASRVGKLAHSAGFKVSMTWQADLDKLTCGKCDHLDGEERTLPDEFDALPPLHPRCRCHVLTDIT
jgi:hypothetical protein